MGEVTNQPKSLEDRIRAVTEIAKQRNFDFDICYVAARQEWTTNWGEGLNRSRLEDLLEVVEEDMRLYNAYEKVVKEDPQ
jgi:hypothetical protein